MKHKFIILYGTIYLFLTATIYTAHNYREPIANKTINVSLSEFGLFDMFGIIKFFGAFFWTNLADRTGRGFIIGSICLSGYFIFFILLECAPDFMKAYGLNFWTVIYFFLLNFFLSGCYPITEYILLEILGSKENIKKYYGKIRIGIPIGSLIAHATQLFMRYVFGKRNDNLYNYTGTGLYGIITILTYWILYTQVSKGKFNTTEKFKSRCSDINLNYSSIKTFFTFDIILLIIMSITQGIPRCAVETYLTKFQMNNKVSEEKTRFFLILRLIPEVSLLYMTPYLEGLIGYKAILGLGLVSGVLRPLLLALIDIEWFNEYSIFFWVAMEIIKAVFSTFFYYGSPRSYNEKSNADNRSLAQGIASGCYNGLGSFISGSIAFLFLDSKWILYQNSQLRGLFLVTGLIAFCGLLSYLVFILKNEKK
ncbi:hypothetical protein TCON_0684 [Astathelohania contejeani]|uniref:Major facilitator superfamily associated domain-containing protein n=1 Tax=Astathelohania contejeani TaxID=164912 RepID=A0ABQ7I159_9MICR|nr:hypothetical protein TCON_0684 [Thelohania contejeani]